MSNKDLFEIIKDTLESRPHVRVRDREAAYTEASVLIPLFRDNGKYKVLFTKRTDQVETHKGQISFPGGAKDEEDGSIRETALREAYEEIGLIEKDVTILGRTDETLTFVSNFVIHPFVGYIPHPYNFNLSREEVERIINVPLDVFFVEKSQRKQETFKHNGKTFQTPSYNYKGNIIWGATARIMENFIDIIWEKLGLPAGGE